MHDEPTIRALLVEDDARLASLTAEYLGKHGIETILVNDGGAGLNEAMSGAFDVLIEATIVDTVMMSA